MNALSSPLFVSVVQHDANMNGPLSLTVSSKAQISLTDEECELIGQP